MSPIVYAVVWAGADIFASLELRVPNTAHISPRIVLHNQVIDRLQRQVVEEFGAGAEITQADINTYKINVDKVRFVRQM